MYNSLFLFYGLGIPIVIIFSLISVPLFTYSKIRISKKFLYLLIIGSSYMLFAQLLKYGSHRFYVDFSHWSNLLYNIANTGYPLSPFHELLKPGTLNYLSVHFIPFIYVIAIPFKIMPYSETIIFMNFILMVSSIIPLYKISLFYSNSKSFGIFMSTIFLWYTSFQYIVLYEFEMLRFSIPVLLWMIYFWDMKKIKLYYFFVLIALFIREEMGLVIFLFGLYLFLFNKKYNDGIITSLIGIAGFFIITKIIMPSLRGDEYQHIGIGFFSSLGGSIDDVIRNVFTKPIFVLKKVFEPNMNLVIIFTNIFMFFLPLLFIPLLSIKRLLPILAPIGVGLLSGHGNLTSFMLYYCSAIIPFLFYSFINSWPKFVSIVSIAHKKVYGASEKFDYNIISKGIVLTGILVSNIIFSPSPLSLQFWSKSLRPANFETQNHHYSAFIVTEHDKKVDDFANLIPDSAIVAAPAFLFPRLYKKRGVVYLNRRETSFDLLKNKRGDQYVSYIFFDTKSKNLELQRYRRTNDLIKKYLDRNIKEWELIKSYDGYFLFRRKNEF